MRRATVRDLRYDFPKVEAALAEGEEIEIVKRNKVVGHLSPAKRERLPMPDFMANIKKVYGDKVLSVTGADVVADGREERI